jgi:hypothetical protein
MNEKEFCYWLKGYFEISNSKKLNEEQVKILKDHLELVFTKVTPDYSNISKINFTPGFRNLNPQPSNLEYPIFPNQTIC